MLALITLAVIMKGSYCKAHITHIASYLATIIFIQAYIAWPICISMIHKHICVAISMVMPILR